jgi:L-ascorbate metabolism protein UlaG (beta-lactamase superfamily)
MCNIRHTVTVTGFLGVLFFQAALVQASVGQDTFAIHSLGHGSLYFEYKNHIMHVDPYSSQADYAALPDADLIFITHGHSDHYDVNALNKIKTDSTLMICTQAVKNLGTYSGTNQVMNNGDSIIAKGIPVKAVPAYNITGTTVNHPKGVGNGYILTIGEKRVYIAGDTEILPAMDSLGKIDVAFLPMNLPYTMSVSMAADAAKKIKPVILYIYHFGTSDTASLRNLLSSQGMDIRMGTSVYYESDKRSSVSGVQNIKIENKTPFSSFHSDRYRSSGSSAMSFDLAGRLVQKQRLNALARGAYIVKLRGDGLSPRGIALQEIDIKR